MCPKRTRLVALFVLLVASVPIAAPRAAPVTYRIAPGAGQSVRFEARTNTEKYGGNTDQISGEARVDPDNFASHPIAFFTIRPASFATGNGSRDSNMRRKHLNVDLFPTASFVLTALNLPAKASAPVLRENQPVSGTLRGVLTLHGVSRAISPAVTVTRERDRVTGRDSLHIVARFTVRLQEYAIPVPRFLFLATKQEHPITVDVHAVAAP